MIHAEDESFHKANEDPYWSESGWFAFNIPERRIGGWIYFFHRPNMRLSAGGVSLWDASGADVLNCLYHDFEHIQALPDGADMFDFTLDNGLAVQCLDPLGSYRMAYGSAEFDMDLTWDAIMSPHAESVENVALEGWSEPLAPEHPTGHYEQGGRIAGGLRLGSEKLRVDGFSIRDHSWGPRKLSQIPRADYAWGIGSEECSFESIAVSTLALDEDPFTGTADPVVSGWYTRDGELGHLVGGVSRVERRPSDGQPLHIELTANDHLGRQMQATGTVVNGLLWRGYGSLMAWNCTTRWELDGTVVWGENDFYCPARLARKFLRSGSAS